MKSVFKQLKKTIGLLFCLLLVANCENNIQINPDQDWPQFKRDNYRSGNGTIQLDLKTLGEAWAYNASQLPVPAWYGPAKEDTYAKSGPLPSMRDYDLSYYPIIVGNRLFYGSTSDHAIHCLDTKTGKELWTFTTGGPIRIAPTFHNNRLYFGSDDGFVYCIKATNGNLVWSYSPSDKEARKVLNNRSLISFWPIRTGVLIEDGIAYFGASLLPWKDSYFCAINAETGKPEGEGTYVKIFENMTLEGAMASTGEKLIQPQGRISPMFFNKFNGESKGQIAGTGGCFVLVTPEKNIVHAQTSRYKSITETIGDFAENPPEDKGPKADFMSFKNGKEMVVKDSISYILTDNSLSAYSRTSKKVIWIKHNYRAHRIIESGDRLFVGATDTVYAVSTKNGLPLWKAPVRGVVYALAVADDALFASTGEGRIYCFRNGKTENKLLAENSNKNPVLDKPLADKLKQVSSTLSLQAGPFVNTVSPTSVAIHFETYDATVPSVLWSDGVSEKEIKATVSSKQHKIIVDSLKKDFIYSYQIKHEDAETQVLEFDNFFNYENTLSFQADEESMDRELLSKVKSLINNSKSIAVVFGAQNISTAQTIAQIKGVKVFLFEISYDKTEELREALHKTGVYGGKIEVQHVTDMDNLPITADIADLVIINNDNFSADEAIRLTKPNGYTVIDKRGKDYGDWLEKAENSWQVGVTHTNDFDVLKKAPYEATGTWTHQYGLPDNTAFGGESLWGSTGTEDFEIQWMGRPGPRFQTDRSGRKPSPLAVNGKMFVQGRDRIVAVDAYNGNIFWSKEIPFFNRMNVLKDCSNWSADDNFIYAAVKHNLLKINSDNGNIKAIIPVVNSKANSVNDWGYISSNKNLIIGSSVPKNSAYTNYYGNEGWYDSESGPLSDKVVSYSLFAKDKEKLNDVWVYEKPNTFIINPTITINGNQISFIVSKNPDFKLTKEFRADPTIFKNLYLVVLDVNSGKELLNHSINVMPGITNIYMAASKDQNVLLTANAGYYYIYNFNNITGELNWEQKQPWFDTHHGGHYSKPAIVNNRLIVKPAMYYLDTGKLMDKEVPKAGHGCASYALTEQSVFYRGGSVTQYNFDTEKFSQWDRLRPDCWISTIPAQGMVLSPEAGGGCSCGNWLEISMVFAPKSRAPITFIYKDRIFMDSVSVEIKSRDTSNKNIYYTTDGSAPSRSSTLYKKAIPLYKTTTLKAIIYVEKNGEEISYSRTKTFEKARPEPKIVEIPQLLNGKWEFYIEKTGATGAVHYTTDGTEPTINSPLYTSPVQYSKNSMVKAKTFWKESNGVIESKETNFEMLIPKLKPAVQIEAQQGISRYYYKEQSEFKDIPKLEELTPKTKAIVNQIQVTPYENSNKCALRFSGFIDIPVDGMYTLSSKSSRSYNFVQFHDAVIESRGNNEESQVFALQKGLHAIQIDHFVTEGPSDYDLLIEGPNMVKQSLGAHMLYRL
ncbi:outer membrane protein assembly factor BamB family protein [Aestuariivivens marinum]|uniref:outer membrane protein assembly factor BamB family protein n=1 Tax=Aestuariivivens marinum TaxID=2913555 RepID=UPI001F585D04|nr:PQQ-binding-like beta-propeller repeat protein [Aestuariivivens marinum]